MLHSALDRERSGLESTVVRVVVVIGNRGVLVHEIFDLPDKIFEDLKFWVYRAFAMIGNQLDRLHELIDM
jgi:hypothetical protein